MVRRQYEQGLREYLGGVDGNKILFIEKPLFPALNSLISKEMADKANVEERLVLNEETDTGFPENKAVIFMIRPELTTI